MITPRLRKPIRLPLLALVLLVSTCGLGDQLPATTGAVDAIPAGAAKIIKAPGASRYANIHCALRDRLGRLWFGTTSDGVYRYDGKSFVHFLAQDGLGNNTVHSIAEDQGGNIWFGTEGGISRYSGTTLAPVPFSVTDFVSSGSPAAKISVFSILRDKNGKMWFGTSEGVYCHTGTDFARFPGDSGVLNREALELKMVQCMLEDRTGTIWFGSGPPASEGVVRFDGKSLTRFKPGGDGWIRYLREDKRGIVWLGTRSRGVWRHDGKTFARFTDKEGLGAPMLVDRLGNIWFSGEEADNAIGSKEGMWRYDGTAFQNLGTKDGLGNYSVWCVVEGDDGKVWVGTRNNGLYRYDGQSFTSFSE